MQSISRQVLKKRKGVSIPISELKSQKFTPNLYLDAELKKLDTVLNENDVSLDGKKLYYSVSRLNRRYFQEIYSIKNNNIFRSDFKRRTRSAQ